MNNYINVTAQLELGFNNSRRLATHPRRQTRIERAAWWFTKMRAAVDNAMTWTPKPLPQPQQTWFPQTQRTMGA